MADTADARGAPVADHTGRRDRLRARIAGLDLDAVLITDPVHVRWASGFTGSNGQVLLPADGEALLITDARYDARAQVEAPDLERVLRRDPVGVAIDKLGPARLGFEADHLTWQAGEDIRARIADAGGAATPVRDEIASLRMVKDTHELALLRRACEITTGALAWLFDDVVEEGRTERELARVLEQRFVDLGAEAVAFDTIVASGPNAAVPHHAPTERALAAGDLLTIDCGARVGGYHADCTRTVGIGHLDERLREVYGVVERAQAAGRAAVAPGATGGDVDEAARQVVEQAGYGDQFVHGTGHGVGLEIHEAPAIGRGSAATLEAGMTLTVEPGVYLPDIGGVRIEDTVVVTADGPAHPLTELPRGLRVL